MNILADFHHVSLANSLRLTLGKRLGHTVFRPIGLEWYHEGFWAVYNHPDTAKQYLDLEQAFTPPDGTPVLNEVAGGKADGQYWIRDHEYDMPAAAVTLERFKGMQFDYLIASIPQHIKPFIELRDRFQPKAKVIFQAGNDWSLDGLHLEGVDGVMASIEPQVHHLKMPLLWYHQEFDTTIFRPRVPQTTSMINSFINVLQHTPGWEDFETLERYTRYFGMEWRSFGGQCRDGCIDGAKNLAAAIHRSEFVFQVKHTGDGFGHIIHNAYACGRPVITRSSHYRGKLAGQLLVPGTFIDLDKFTLAEAKNLIGHYHNSPEMLIEAGRKAAVRFAELVDFKAEAMQIKTFLETI